MAGSLGSGALTLAKRILPGLAYFFVFLCLWQLAIVVFGVKEFVLPSPLRVMEHLFNLQKGQHYDWWKHIGATALEVIVSFLVTAALGIFIAILVTWSRVLAQIIMPIVTLFNSLPKVAVAPLFLLWFGYGLLPNILIAFLMAFFPVVINSIAGLKAVDDDLLDLVRYLHASKLNVFIKIRIPNALPYMFAGIKISATMCVVGAIVGEFLASEKGLGFQLRDAQAFIDTPTMFACLLLLSVIGLLFFSLIGFLERICMPWNAAKDPS
ncbi:MAG: ABC transporter permease [Candidatus Accumulibacter sp.]|jgi:NitT/TauT family transport system permease protein|nr:ABC transporter permease [Accumulibacter sp.]